MCGGTLSPVSQGKRVTSHDDEFVQPPFFQPEKKKRKKPPEPPSRAMSYVIGVFMLLLGAGMLVGYQYLQRGPSKLFNLLMAGGVGALLSGVGLFVKPLDDDQLNTFQNEPNPITVFKVMPIFWKIWLLIILAAMIGAFVYVAQTTVRVGR